MVWYAAPLLVRGRDIDLPSRLRCMLVLLVAIPLVLAAVHLLVLWALFAAAAIFCYLRFRFSEAEFAYDAWDGIVAAITLLVASPNIVHPPIEGDSLAYHLPNAMAWVQTSSLDPTWMRYWWFPPGSEIAIAGVIAAGGLWIAGIPSLLAAGMLATRIGRWLQTLDVSPAAATAIAAAFVTITTVAFQTYDERNDVFLAAFFVECLWLTRDSDWEAVLPVAVLSLVKADGWLYAIVAIACMGKPRAFVGVAPIVLWAMHDVAQAGGAQMHVAGTTLRGVWASTIAANVPDSLRVLGRALVERGPAIVCCFFGPLAGFFGSREERRIAAAGVLACALFVLTPYSYVNPLPQLALGNALRYDMAALAIGAVCLAPLARAVPALLASLALLSALAGIVRLIVVFSSDGVTPIAFGGAALVVVLAIFSRTRVAGVVAGALCFALFAFGTYSASTRAYSFYGDEMPRIGNGPTTFFTWFAQHPHTVMTLGIRAGELLVMAPSATVIDTGDVDCAAAVRDGAWLVVGADRDVTASTLSERMRAARRCGSAVFSDADVLAVSPR